MANNKELRPLVVKFRVDINGKTFKPGTYNTLTGKEYETLKAAPYVREATDEEMEKEAAIMERETAARKAKGIKVGKKETPNNNLAPADDNNGNTGTGSDTNVGSNDDENNQGATGAEDATTFTKEELEALPEADLRALYAAEQAKAGKGVPPTNIKVETIIANLTK